MTFIASIHKDWRRGQRYVCVRVYVCVCMCACVCVRVRVQVGVFILGGSAFSADENEAEEQRAALVEVADMYIAFDDKSLHVSHPIPLVFLFLFLFVFVFVFVFVFTFLSHTCTPALPLPHRPPLSSTRPLSPF